MHIHTDTCKYIRIHAHTYISYLNILAYVFGNTCTYMHIHTDTYLYILIPANTNGYIHIPTFHCFHKKNPLFMCSTIGFGTASKAAPQGRLFYDHAEVGFELAIKQWPARCLDH